MFQERSQTLLTLKEGEKIHRLRRIGQSHTSLKMINVLNAIGIFKLFCFISSDVSYTIHID